MEEIRKIKLNAEGLDPKLVKEKVAQKKEELKRTEKVTRAEAKEKALKVMREVGIDEPEKKGSNNIPSSFQGGVCASV